MKYNTKGRDAALQLKQTADQTLQIARIIERHSITAAAQRMRQVQLAAIGGSTIKKNQFDCFLSCYLMKYQLLQNSAALVAAVRDGFGRTESLA